MAKEKNEKTLKINPWWAIWFKPRQTIQKVVTFDPRLWFKTLAGIYGLQFMLSFAQSSEWGDQHSLYTILILAFLFSWPIGTGLITAFAWLLKRIGSWCGAKGTKPAVKAAVAWSNVPHIVTCVCLLVLSFVFGREFYMDSFGFTFYESYLFSPTHLLLALALISGVWGFVILVGGVSKVQKISLWKSFLNVVLSMVIMGIFISVAVSTLVGLFNAFI